MITVFKWFNYFKKSYSRYTYGKAVLGSVRVNLAVLDDAGKAERFSTSIHTVRMRTTYTIPYYAIPYHTIPYHTMPCHTIPYHTIPYHTIPYYTILYHTIPYLLCHTIHIPYHTISYHTIPYRTMSCCVMLCDVMWCCVVSCHVMSFRAIHYTIPYTMPFVPYHTLPYILNFTMINCTIYS